MKTIKFAVAFATSAALAVGAVTMATPVGAHNSTPHAVVHHLSGLQVGLVTDKGGLNDKSFNHLADLGLIEAEMKLGANPQCKQPHNKPPKPTCGVLQSHSGSDYEPNLTAFAHQFAGHSSSVIIAVGFLMEQAIYDVAQQFPNQKFAIVDGQPADSSFNPHDLPNVADLFFKPEQSGYLAGVVAGLLEKEKLDPLAKKHHKANNVIGSIAGANFSAVTAYNCGYQDGAKSVNKKIKVLTSFDDGSFQNTANANGIGKLQISKHADILFQVDGGAGLGYLQAAKNGGVWGIGVDADQDFLGKYVITSALKKVDQAVFLTVKSLKAGKFNAGPNTFDLKNNATGIVTNTKGSGASAPVHHIPASILKIVNNDAKKIKNGSLKLPADDGTGTCHFTAP